MSDGQVGAPAAERAAMPLEIAALTRAYAAGETTAEAVLDTIYARIAATAAHHAWILVRAKDAVLADLAAARARRQAGADLPLFGVPFAVKDNIDVAGLPTTVACPGAAYVPEVSAPVVAALREAGALLVGKTNLDQFATGLVGSRSPYGACANAFDAAFVSGGSSSGSAVAVALGLVSFALGTDTAGSGRVPAAFNNVVGLKPSVGLWSTRGVFPACRSLDCVSVFALSCDDARRVHGLLETVDPGAPLSRADRAPRSLAGDPARRFRFGVLREDQRRFFGDDAYAALYDRAIATLEALGGSAVPVDFAPFAEAGALLYGGGFLAERWAAFGRFVAADAEGLDPTVRAIVAPARDIGGAAVFDSLHALAGLRRRAMAELAGIDVLALPTAGTLPSRAAVAAEPIRRNVELSTYTTFVNLLDLCAVAVPAGFAPSGLPFGLSLIALPCTEYDLLALADRFHRAQSLPAGALGRPLATAPLGDRPAPAAGHLAIAVVGAHLDGQPLNHQLTERGGRLIRVTRTSPDYRLYALAGGPPARPGLVHGGAAGGAPIALEVWSLPAAGFTDFVAQVPPPLAIGTVTLADGETVKGFVAEPRALDGAVDITGHGGWRAYLAAQPQ